MTKQLALSKHESRALIEACFADLVVKANYPFVPKSAFPDLEIAQQLGLAKERIEDLLSQVDVGQFDASVQAQAERLFSAKQDGWENLHQRVRQDLFEGVARALIEQQRLFIFRLADRLTRYAPVDPLFASQVSAQAVLSPLQIFQQLPTLGTPAQASPVGAKIGELVDKYLAAKKGAWAAKTYDNGVRQMAFVTEHFGPETFASAVQPADVVAFRDAANRLRRNHHHGAGKSFVARQTDVLEQRIDHKTAKILFDACKTFFRWAEAQVEIAHNPAAKIQFPPAQKSKGKKSRLPFSAEQLTTIFSAPNFTGAHSQKRRFEAGEKVFADAKFWIPLIGFFTGMRLAEIVQLQLSDVHLSPEIPYIDVTYDGSGEVGSGQEKHLKSGAAVRRVPLHPDLMALGFASFADRRFKAKKGKGRLFFEVEYGADGVPSSRFSKWFARFLDKVGLTDRRLVFHSFRHNAEDAFRNAKEPQYVINDILGHAGQEVPDGYSNGVDLETAYAAVLAMKLKLQVLTLIKAPHN